MLSYNSGFDRNKCYDLTNGPRYSGLGSAI